MGQLILLPGLAANAVMWQHQLRALPMRLQPQVTDVHAHHDTIEDMARALLAQVAQAA